MKMTLCTLAICLVLAAAFFSTRSLLRSESKRVLAAISALAGDGGEDGESGDGAGIHRGIEAVGNQLATINRRLTTLEERVAANQGTELKDINHALTALRQELATMSAAQNRLGALPGYLADLTRFLDSSFAHIDKSLKENTLPDSFETVIEEIALRLEAMETLFEPLYEWLGLMDKGGEARDKPRLLEELNAQMEGVGKQVGEVRKDIEELRKWMSKRDLEPGERP